MKTEVKLGEAPPAGAGRDAVHVAVCPAVAGGRLQAGDHVGRLPDGRYGALGRPYLGVVDPFFRDWVEVDQQFWLCLFPGTVTSLRHHWTHPSFEDVLRGEPGPADADRAYSERWLREYAAKMSHYDDPETAYREMLDGLRNGELFYNGSDLHDFSEVEQPDELQHHAGIVLGRPVNIRGMSFSCSC